MAVFFPTAKVSLTQPQGTGSPGLSASEPRRGLSTADRPDARLHRRGAAQPARARTADRGGRAAGRGPPGTAAAAQRISSAAGLKAAAACSSELINYRQRGLLASPPAGLR